MIKESTLSRSEMQRLIDSGYRCQCGSLLSVAWGGKFGYQGYILRCGRDVDHVNFERPIEQDLHTDCNMPGWKMSRRRRTALVEKVGQEKAQALMKYQGVATLTKVELADIMNTMWPGADNASPAEVKKAILLCSQYGLNPLANHLYLIPFETKDKKTGAVVKVTYAAVKGINARRLIARRKHSYSEINNTPRYMTEEEEERAWKTVNEDEVRFIVTLRDMVTGATASGYGRWPKWRTWTNPKTGEVKRYPNDPKGVEKGNSAENMAAIRAERIALDKLYPADMPSAIPFEDEYLEQQRAQQSVVIEPSENSQVKPASIDAETGEILDGVFSESESQEEPGGIVVEEDPKPVTATVEGKVVTGESTTVPTAPPSKPQQAKQSAKKSTAPVPGTREYDIQMIRSAASRLKWDNKRLTDEMAKKYAGVISFDGLTDDELQEFASKITDMAECA